MVGGSWQQVFHTRGFVWSVDAIVAAALMFTPGLDDSPCEQASVNGLSPRAFLVKKGVLKIGSHFGLICTAAVFLAVLLDPNGRFDSKIQLHVWARRYGLCFLLGSAVISFWPWFPALCPVHYARYDSASVALVFLLYIASHGILAHMTVLRLRMVASAKEATKAARMMKIVLLLGALCSVAGGLYAEVLPKSVGLAICSVLIVADLLAYLTFQYRALTIFLEVARDARKEAERDISDAQPVATAQRALATVALFAASAGTTVIYSMTIVSSVLWESRGTRWVLELSVCFDAPFDAGLVLVCAGLVGPIGDLAADLACVSQMAERGRERRIREKLVEVARATAGPALTLAALFEGEDPDVLIARAVVRFRCIGGGPLDGRQASTDLYEQSMPCRVGQCDAFFSHSWHDDAHQKWEALKGWCTDFETTKQHTPRLWLDKVCIDQTNIALDLQCLPIFLAACNLFLAISGPTYTSRLWCCVELFVYVNMHTEGDVPIIIMIGADDAERARAGDRWRDFDVETCQCAMEEDRTRILSVIGRHPGGIQVFNTNVKAIATALPPSNVMMAYGQEQLPCTDLEQGT